MARKETLADAEQRLRERGLSFPEVTEEFPWGHRALKVKGKAFTFLVSEHGELRVSLKLPHSNEAALTMPFAEPTRYGLGKSGWVTCTFLKGSHAPVGLLEAWLAESYRAIAPKKLVAAMDEVGTEQAGSVRRARPKRVASRGKSKAAPRRRRA